MRVFANILTVDDTQIRIAARTAVLNAFAIHTSLLCPTDDAAPTAVHTVCLKIRRLDAVNAGCRHAAAVRITAITSILAYTVQTGVRSRVRCRIIRTRIVTCATMRSIRTMRVLADILTADNAEIRIVA